MISQSAARQWLPALLLLAVIVIVGEIPGKSIEQLLLALSSKSGIRLTAFELIHFQTALRKFSHFVCYGLLSALIFSTRKMGGIHGRIAYSLLMTLAIATIDELRQLIGETRTASLLDILLDVLGAIYVQGMIAIALLRSEATKG